MVSGGNIQEANTEASECTFVNRKICSSPNEINLMKEFIKNNLQIKIPADISNIEVVELLKKELNVDSEAKIWEHQQFKESIGESKAQLVLKKYFNPVGPSDSIALLDNFNIDDKLEQWSINGMALFQKKFYHIPFQMIDFEKQGTELSRVHLMDLIEKKYDCFGVVLNTDITAPGHGGKHWFCLYGDLKHQGTESDPYTIEYFNSSGNPPMREVDIWM